MAGHFDRLHIRGTESGHISFHPMSEPARGQAGDVYVNEDGVLHVHNGTSWVDSASAVVTSPYTLTAVVPAVDTASSLKTAVIYVPFAGNVTAVRYAPSVAITGQNTNYRAIKLTESNGSVEIAVLDLTAAVSIAQATARTVPVTGSAGAVAVDAGQILLWRSNAVGNGLADPGGLVIVTITPA